MPIQGFVRLRKHQLARQAVFGTAIAATRAYPFQGVPDVNLNWTDPEGDFGSLFPVAAPYRGMPDIGSSPSIPQLDYNSLPALFAAMFGGAVVPTPGGVGLAGVVLGTDLGHHRTSSTCSPTSSATTSPRTGSSSATGS